MIASEDTQCRVATIALAATMPRDFALAGSGAIREHGLTKRPTADIDLFSDDRDPAHFTEALDDLVAQLESDGMQVECTRRFELFARLRVEVDTEVVDIDLGVDWRASAPVLLAIGAVLDEPDAVGNKVAALFSRAEPRDYLDVDAIRASGRWPDAVLLRAAADRDAGFDPGFFAQQLRAIRRFGPRRVHEYAVNAEELEAIARRLEDWADQIEADLMRR